MIFVNLDFYFTSLSAAPESASSSYNSTEWLWRILGEVTGIARLSRTTCPLRGAPQSPCAGPRHITLSEARSRLDRSRFSRPNTHFLAFFKIYKKITFSRANSGNFCQEIGKFCQNFDIFWQILQNFAKFSEIRKNFAKFCRIFCRILQKCVDFEKC